MQITLYKCADDPKKIDKTISDSQVITVQAKEPIDIMQPEFYLNYNSALLDHNYLQAFGKYYFAKYQVEPGGSMRIKCFEDVLFTFKAGILAAPCICARNTNQYNSAFPDSRYRTIQRKVIETKLLFTLDNDDYIIFGFVE